MAEIVSCLSNIYCPFFLPDRTLILHRATMYSTKGLPSESNPFKGFSKSSTLLLPHICAFTCHLHTDIFL